MVKNLPANAGDVRDMGSTPGLGRSPGEGHGNPLQYSCLENPVDQGAWWTTVHRAAKSWAQLNQLSVHTRARAHTHTHTHTEAMQSTTHPTPPPTNNWIGLKEREHEIKMRSTQEVSHFFPEKLI